MKYSLGGDEEMGSRSHYFVDIEYLEFQTFLNDIFHTRCFENRRNFN